MKRALVSGASRGLGRELAVGLSALGFETFGIGRDAAALAETKSRTGPGPFTALPIDLADSAAIGPAVSRLAPLDLVIANAGIAVVAPALEHPIEEFARVLAINVTATFELVRTAARDMAPGGTIVIIASDAAFRGIPGMAAYSASKHAVAGLARSLELELEPRGVRVVSVYPASIRTEILGPPVPGYPYMEPADAARSILAAALGQPESVNVREIHLAAWTPPSAPGAP